MSFCDLLWSCRAEACFFAAPQPQKARFFCLNNGLWLVVDFVVEFVVGFELGRVASMATLEAVGGHPEVAVLGASVRLASRKARRVAALCWPGFPLIPPASFLFF